MVVTSTLMHKPNKSFIFLLKILVSTVFVCWAVYSSNFSYENFIKGISDLKLLAAFMGLTFLQLLIGTLRTHSLMLFKTFVWSDIGKILRITWSSAFIGTVAPISLLGDAFRIKGLMDVDSLVKKDNTLYASLVTKIFSVVALALIIVGSALFIDVKSKEVKSIVFIALGVVVVLTLLLALRKRITFLINTSFLKLLDFKNTDFIQNRINNFRTYGKALLSIRKISYNILLSVLIQLLNTISLILIIYTIAPDVSLSVFELAGVIPVGIFFMVLPVSYGGLGVGHVAFAQVLSLYGLEIGADVFNLFFVYSFIFNLGGALFLLGPTRSKSFKEKHVEMNK